MRDLEMNDTKSCERVQTVADALNIERQDPLNKITAFALTCAAIELWHV